MLTPKSLRLALVLAATTALAVPLVLRAQGFRQNQNGITVYEDINFKGRSVTIDRDVPDLRAFGFDRKVSSFRLGSNDRWEVCSGRNFTGRCVTFGASVSDLRRASWNDDIMSIRRAGTGRPAFGAVRPGSLELFAGTDFSGKQITLTSAQSDFRRFDFNDRALSLRAVSGESWEVCANINFDDCRVVDGELSNLARYGLAGISSARPRSRGWSLRPAATVELYAGVDFSGEMLTLTGSIPDLNRLSRFNDRAESIRIPRGQRWEVCVNAKFDDCRVLDRDVADLSQMGLSRNISSVRPHVGR